jgi:hypothetical protein
LGVLRGVGVVIPRIGGSVGGGRRWSRVQIAGASVPVVGVPGAVVATPVSAKNNRSNLIKRFISTSWSSLELRACYSDNFVNKYGIPGKFRSCIGVVFLCEK